MRKTVLDLGSTSPLENDMLTIDDGTQVQISKCPNEHGKIKSPLCCGQDMTCTV